MHSTPLYPWSSCNVDSCAVCASLALLPRHPIVILFPVIFQIQPNAIGLLTVPQNIPNTYRRQNHGIYSPSQSVCPLTGLHFFKYKPSLWTFTQAFPVLYTPWHGKFTHSAIGQVSPSFRKNYFLKNNGQHPPQLSLCAHLPCSHYSLALQESSSQRAGSTCSLL